jgi:hypothetical protein
VPTWVYRGFTNVGVDDGFMFTALGGDHTGGVLWGPTTVAAAQRQGVFLTRDYRMVDTTRGEARPRDDELFQPMSAEEISALRVWTAEQMARQVPLDTRLPEMLRSGKRLRGIFNGIPSPAIVEMCAYAGFDFLLIDNEHGSADLQTTEHMLRAARASNLPTLVRCLEHDIARTLDIGAGGLQIPMVSTAAHAAALVQRVKYPLAPGASGLSRPARQCVLDARGRLRRFRWSGAHPAQQCGYCAGRDDRDARGSCQCRAPLPQSMASMASSSDPTTWPMPWGTRTAGTRPRCRWRSSRP